MINEEILAQAKTQVEYIFYMYDEINKKTKFFTDEIIKRDNQILSEIGLMLHTLSQLLRASATKVDYLLELNPKIKNAVPKEYYEKTNELVQKLVVKDLKHRMKKLNASKIDTVAEPIGEL